MLHRRLIQEQERLLRLPSKSPLIEVEQANEFGDTFIITYHVKGLMWLEGAGAPSISTCHRMELYFHERFPRFPPRLLWLSSIFHPNILSNDENGGVCIGKWAPSQLVDDLVVMIGEMVQYKLYNIHDPLNPKAARWAEKMQHLLPVDKRNIIGGG